MGFPRIGTIPALAALAAIALTVSLGNWQTRRAEGKIALQEHIAAAVRATPVELLTENLRGVDGMALAYRHVRLTGTWLPERVVYLENRMRGPAAGMFVIMALQVADARGVQQVLVNRGWLPRDGRERTRIVPYATPAGEVTVDGVVFDNEPKLLELGQANAPRLGALWQNLDYDAWQRASGVAPVRMVVRQDATVALKDGLVRDWPEAGAGIAEQIGKHRGYAFQWYGLAALLIVLVVFFELRKRRAAVRPTAGADGAPTSSS